MQKLSFHLHKQGQPQNYSSEWKVYLDTMTAFPLETFTLHNITYTITHNATAKHCSVNHYPDTGCYRSVPYVLIVRIRIHEWYRFY